jgi:hypothetical protein
MYGLSSKSTHKTLAPNQKQADCAFFTQFACLITMKYLMLLTAHYFASNLPQSQNQLLYETCLDWAITLTSNYTDLVEHWYNMEFCGNQW